ncbi:hypothetical protein GCM10010347_24050 [Streptomyces cirratus]|uniref:Peptidoglycan binding-like domain-containing protein n=1 Tax=Streptomyces cirratus TaxID=68187 RepID=A0ABQ3ERC7_9ACTN|nr:peptidoglycan-binding domain-containing protein [Streptomyces cirratus]GHB53235.1 hypothetical protein GCM10010347_24050 [Streptomyces cirratus]
MPDDGLLVRPYVAAPGRPSCATDGPTWPEGTARPVPPPAPAAAGSPVPDRRGRGARVAAVLGLLALTGAGALVFLLSGPDPEPARAEAPPGLSVPVLPARSPDAETGSSPAVPDRPKTSAPAPATATPSGPVSSPGARPGSTPRGGPPGTTAPPAEDSGTLRQGDKGPEVRVLQQRLYAQGFTYVAVTGVYDGRTRRGVAQLQSDRDIKGDPPGVYGPATRAAFG